MLTRRHQAVLRTALHGWQAAGVLTNDWTTNYLRQSQQGGTFTDPDQGPAWWYQIGTNGLTTIDRERNTVDRITWDDLAEHAAHLPTDVQNRLNQARQREHETNQRHAELSYPNQRTDPEGWEQVGIAVQAMMPEVRRRRADLEAAIDAALPLARQPDNDEPTDLFGYTATT